jgi:predicted methyltransferase
MEHPDHVALIRDGVPEPGGTWADLGSGSGAFTLALADLLGPGGTIVSVDIDEGALRYQARDVAARFSEVELDVRVEDFRTCAAAMPPLDGIVMANALHFVTHDEQLETVRRLTERLVPGGHFVVVEYDADRGNPWVPHPFRPATWRATAEAAGLTGTREIGRVPSRWLDAIWSAVSEKPRT